MTLTGMMRQLRADAHNPLSILPMAAATPATSVPWPLSSQTSLLLKTKFQPSDIIDQAIAVIIDPILAISPGFDPELVLPGLDGSGQCPNRSWRS